jgi:hypothetical protein
MNTADFILSPSSFILRKATVRGVEPRGTGLESVCSPRSTPLCKTADLNTEAGSDSCHSLSSTFQ